MLRQQCLFIPPVCGDPDRLSCALLLSTVSAIQREHKRIIQFDNCSFPVISDTRCAQLALLFIAIINKRTGMLCERPAIRMPPVREIERIKRSPERMSCELTNTIVHELTAPIHSVHQDRQIFYIDLGIHFFFLIQLTISCLK